MSNFSFLRACAMTAPISFTIRAFAASKANSRMLVPVAGTGRMKSIKSAAARAFVRDCKLQCPKRADLPFTVPVRVSLRMYYPSDRADLDESALLDALQSYSTLIGRKRVIHWPGIWLNDRLVREKHVYHGVDAANPRIEVHVEEL